MEVHYRYQGQTNPIQNDVDHLTVYDVTPRKRTAQDQFGGHPLAFEPCRMLCVPTKKNPDDPIRLDHFKVYDVQDNPVDIEVFLLGQFDDQPQPTRVTALTHFANPVQKNEEPIEDKNAHLTWYAIEQDQEEPERKITVRNQFGERPLVLGQPRFLLAPAEKLEPGAEFPSQLDHFKCYEVLKGEPIDVVVHLKDQFGVENHVVVGTPKFFCVPVEKRLTDAELPNQIQNANDHLTVYEIMPKRRLVVDQFLAEGQGQLEFAPCEMLCVPSRKEFPGAQE